MAQMGGLILFWIGFGLVWSGLILFGLGRPDGRADAMNRQSNGRTDIRTGRLEMLNLGSRPDVEKFI